jgi:surface protein
VTNMSDMFSGNTAFDQNISNWNVTKVGSRHYNFDYNTSISWTAAEKPRWVA